MQIDTKLQEICILKENVKYRVICKWLINSSKLKKEDRENSETFYKKSRHPELLLNYGLYVIIYHLHELDVFFLVYVTPKE